MPPSAPSHCLEEASAMPARPRLTHRSTAVLAVLLIALVALPGVASARPADDSTGPRSQLVAEPSTPAPTVVRTVIKDNAPDAADRARRRRPDHRHRRHRLRAGPHRPAAPPSCTDPPTPGGPQRAGPPSLVHRPHFPITNKGGCHEASPTYRSGDLRDRAMRSTRRLCPRPAPRRRWRGRCAGPRRRSDRRRVAGKGLVGGTVCHRGSLQRKLRHPRA